jgi:hypothetical protein
VATIAGDKIMKSFSVELNNGSVFTGKTLEEVIAKVNYWLDWDNRLKISKITKWTGSNTSTTLQIGDE